MGRARSLSEKYGRERHALCHPGAMSNLSTLERSGIAAGIITGILATTISIIGLIQTQAAEQKANDQAQAAQADLVVTEMYPHATKRSSVQVVVQNFSNLPIYRISIVGRDSDDEVGTLPPCSQIDVTGIAQPPGEDLGWSDGVPPVGLEYSDASGLRWSRVGAQGPQRGMLSAGELASIRKGSHQGGSEFGLQPSTPIKSCS